MTILRSRLLAALSVLALATFSPNIAHSQTAAPVDANPAPAPAAVAPASPGVESPASTGSAIVELDAAARDPRTLNPFLIPTDLELQQNLDLGRGIGQSKKDLIDVLDSGRRGFQFRNGGMLGEKRRVTGSAIWVTPGLEARWRGFIEGRNYADAGQRQADFDALRNEITQPQRSLTFIVEIGDLIPGHPADPAQAQIDAAYESLAGTHFVLSDDNDNNYAPSSTVVAPHLMVRQDFYDAISPGADHLTAEDAFSSAPQGSHQLVLRRQPYSDLAAFYIVTFNAFNADGAARINRDVHSVVLRIVTPTDTKYAYFDMSKTP
ncbi:MAG: hypothetical protein ACLQVD_22645 [Capsulimonadaceae bacterium]